MKIEFSPRYLVMGIYKDRDRNIWRIYPWPCIRISFGGNK